jgi:hypothetical protein
MPEIRPGRGHYAVATKEVAHGAPCIEDGFAGVAIKQVVAPGGTGLGDDLITNVQIGENFFIECKGLVYVTNSKQETGTFAKGDAVYIRTSDNLLTATSGGNKKYGRVEAIAGERGVGVGKMRVNLDAKDSF